MHRTVRSAPVKAALSARSSGSVSKAGSRRTAGYANRSALINQCGLGGAIEFKERIEMKEHLANMHGAFYSIFSFLLVIISICLTLLYPGFSNTYWEIRITFLAIFAFGCTGIVLAITGIRRAKKRKLFWLTTMLSIMSLLTNGTTLFFVSMPIITEYPEVKGILRSANNSFVVIDVDVSYRDRYNMKGSRLGSNLPTASEDWTLDVRTSSNTIYSEQFGKLFWEKRNVNWQTLHAGQHVQINYNGKILLDGSIPQVDEIIILN